MYDELRRMARRRMRGEHAGHTLSPTALVHEAYLELARLERIELQNRAHISRARRVVLSETVGEERPHLPGEDGAQGSSGHPL